MELNEITISRKDVSQLESHIIAELDKLELNEHTLDTLTQVTILPFSADFNTMGNRFFKSTHENYGLVTIEVIVETGDLI